MILLTLIHYTARGIGMAAHDRQDRVFCTCEAAENWLRQNDFSLRPRTFLKGDPLDWCHEKEVAWDYIDVQMNELSVDDETPIHFEPIEAPWRAAARRDGFIEALQERGLSPEQIKERYEKHFGEKFSYRL